MQNTFTLLIITFTALLGFWIQPAFAQTPPEVLKPYKAYRAALQAEDLQTASKQAYLAWQAAEKLLGDTKTTGDLAQNYADTTKKLPGPKGTSKQIRQAYRRAIVLAKFHDDNSGEIYLQRVVTLGELAVKHASVKLR